MIIITEFDEYFERNPRECVHDSVNVKCPECSTYFTECSLRQIWCLSGMTKHEIKKFVDEESRRYQCMKCGFRFIIEE